MTIKIKLTFDELKANLEKNHEQIGDGLFAFVFDYGNKVIKISHNDIAYNKFVHMIKNLNNKHFPKIYLHKEYEDICGNLICITIIEKLIELSTNKRKHAKIRRYLITNFGNLNEIQKIFPIGKNSRLAFDIINNLKNQGHNVDLHSGNVMLRKSCLVITDAVS